MARELKRAGASSNSVEMLGSIDAALQEAFAVLSQRSETLGGAVLTSVRGLLSRPKLYNHPTARAWISTELTQEYLRDAVLALLLGDDDGDAAEAAIAHYRSFLNDEGSEGAPSAEDVYTTALDFIQRSLARDLDLGGRLTLTALAGVNRKLDELRPVDTGEFVDTHLFAATEKIRRRRFFSSSDSVAEARDLAGAILEGRFRAATASAAGTGLAKCARWTSQSDVETSSGYLAEARRKLGTETRECRIAAAFLESRSDWLSALARLEIDASPADATAAVQIMRIALGPDDAARRAAAAGIAFDNLDADGRYVLLTLHMQLEELDAALEIIEKLSHDDFDEAPALLWMAATVLVALSASRDLRPVVLQDVPTNPLQFRLRDEEQFLAQRRLARDFLEISSKRCRELELPREAVIAERYALWLGLRDPATRDDALLMLHAKMDDARSTLAFLPLALAFGVDVDPAAAERLIDQHLARGGSDRQLVASAMLALIVDGRVDDPKRTAALFASYRDELTEFIEPTSLLSLEINILAEAGRHREANDILKAASSDVPEAMRELLEGVISGFEGSSSLAALEKVYESDRDPVILSQLVQRHREAGYSDRYLELARQWLDQAPNAKDLYHVVRFLSENKKYSELAELAAKYDAVVQQSDDLLEESAWALYYSGRFSETEKQLGLLESRRENQNDRSLRFQLILVSGRWAELDAFVDDQWRNRDRRDALELAQCASLAAEIGSKWTRDLIRTAAERGVDDPTVLAVAYNAATTAGMEEAFNGAAAWIVRAAELSGSDGPVQSMSLQDIVGQQPQWNERVEEGHQMIAASSGPLETAALMLRKTLVELQLTPMIANLGEKDVRQHVAIPLFSGRRRNIDLARAQTIAFDRSAILTLAAAGLLGDVLTNIDDALVSHDILSRLFEDQRRIKFHQPSKIAFAHQLTTLLQRGNVVAFRSTVTPDAALVGMIGRTLAALLSEAGAQAEGQHIVVHPYPITRVGSLLNDPEPVPLDAYRRNLCSCSAVVDALERGGRITQGNLARARGYLARVDSPWPEEPVIERGATLYLSDLSVSYFRFIGVLDQIESLGLTVVLPQSELDEAMALKRWESFSARTIELVETICSEISRAYGAGRLRFDRIVDTEEVTRSAQTLTSITERADLLICDDRFLNRFESFDHRSGRTPIATSLDLVERLGADETIDAARCEEARALLRSAGALFVPATSDEIIALLSACAVEGGRVRETAELRAVRENIRLGQLRGWFDPPAEAPWLIDFNAALIEALIAQWNENSDPEIARARSDWLMQIVSTEGWADSVVRPGLTLLATHGLILDLSKIAIASPEVAENRQDEFNAWFEELLETRWDNEPRKRELFLDHMRGMTIALIDDTDHEELGISENAKILLALGGFPQFLQVAMMDDDDFRERMGQELGYVVNIGSDLKFTRTRFLDAVRKVYADPDRKVALTDEAGQRWRLGTDASSSERPLHFTANKRKHIIRGIFALLPDAGERVAGLDRVAALSKIPEQALGPWRERLAMSPLDENELTRFEDELRAWPGGVARAIADTIPKGEIDVSYLVPRELLYYERLTGAGEARTISDYCSAIAADHIAALAPGDVVEQAKAALLLASHPRILADGRFPDLSDEQWIALGQWVRDEGDTLARIGFVELSIPRAAGNEDLEAQLLGLVADIEALDAADKAGRLRFVSAVFRLVDAELSQHAILASWPPFRRRIAAFAQAALIERSAFGRIDAVVFTDFAIQHRSSRFFVQSLVDLRPEPRWRPDFIHPLQLKNELIGRSVNALLLLPTEELSDRLRERFVGAEDGITARMNYPMVFWPGPIEGGLTSEIQPPPSHMMEMLEKAFADSNLSLNGLTILVNLETPYRIPASFLDQAVAMIIAKDTAIFSLFSSEQTSHFLLGLAHLAASHRRPDLADHLQMLVRYQRAMAVRVSVSDELRLGLVCAAAREDIDGWRTFLGGWMREVAMQVGDGEAAEQLEGWLETLVSIDPGLPSTTGRAHAAVRLVLGT